MSREEQLGLLGELIVLERLIISNYPNSVHSWVGPLGKYHDFELLELSLEVKCSVHLEHTHVINGLEQLEMIQGKELAIVSLLVDENQLERFTVADRVREIMFLLDDHPDLFEEFNERLVRTGFRYEHEQYYDSNRFNIRISTVFPIDNNFPKLTHSTLSVPLSDRISKVTYIVNLQGLYGYSLDSTEFSILIGYR